MEIAIGTILLTVFLSVVVYSLLAFVTGNKAGCCGHTQDPKSVEEKGSCCSNFKKGIDE